MINPKVSSKVFDELINGRVINAQLVGQDEKFYENPLFTEVMSNLDDYSLHFERCGKSLSKSPSFFVLREDSPVKTDMTMKVCMLMLIMGKFMNVKGWSVDKLIDVKGGISDNEIKEIESVEEICALECLKKADIKGDLLTAVNRILVDRGVMIKKPMSGHYILSNAGESFFVELFNNFKEGFVE